MPENLSGLSAGTVLAVIVRPAGLVMVPQRLEGKTTKYLIEPPTAGQEAWPPGRTSEKPDRDLVPDLFKFIHVEIDETPLADAIEKIQERLEIPFLWDHYAAERKRSIRCKSSSSWRPKSCTTPGFCRRLSLRPSCRKKSASTTPASRSCGSRLSCR